MAEITDPETRQAIPVQTNTSGVFYARPLNRILELGKRLG